MTNDPLADALNTIKTHEMYGMKECVVRPSRLVRETLRILQVRGYVGEFEYVDDGRSGFFKVRLLGKINQTGCIKPRFPVKKGEWSGWEQKFIPGEGFGFLIVSTPKGLMTNEEAKSQNSGGRLIAFVY
jgi:small subunit ribosomal protein S8